VRKQPTSESTGDLILLSISPNDQDQLSLQAIICHSRWKMFTARDLSSALSLLQQYNISVLLCERDLLPGTWIDVLEHINILPNVPSVIVTSRLADHRLWVEALNLGAWDVLEKPLDHTEVMRSVHSAWRHWHNQTHPRPTAIKMISAAS